MSQKNVNMCRIYYINRKKNNKIRFLWYGLFSWILTIYYKLPCNTCVKTFNKHSTRQYQIK